MFQKKKNSGEFIGGITGRVLEEISGWIYELSLEDVFDRISWVISEIILGLILEVIRWETLEETVGGILDRISGWIRGWVAGGALEVIPLEQVIRLEVLGGTLKWINY